MAFQWLFPLVGGVLIGLSAVGFLALFGRVAGISGMVSCAFDSQNPARLERLSFVTGLVVGGVILAVALSASLENASPTRLPLLALAGILVGFGTRLGNGCTSGHGVCGLSRLSARSLVATIVFIGAGVVTVALTKGLVR
jgi:uncharacterized membrane protein YedE/YeeE